MALRAKSQAIEKQTILNEKAVGKSPPNIFIL